MKEPRATPGMTNSALAALTVVSLFTLSNAPTPLYPVWQQEWGFDAGTVAVIFGTYIVGLIGTLLVAGQISDRHGRRVVLVPGLALGVVASILFFVAQNVPLLLVARLLAGIGVGTVLSAGMAAVVDLAPSDKRPWVRSLPRHPW